MWHLLFVVFISSFIFLLFCCLLSNLHGIKNGKWKEMKNLNHFFLFFTTSGRVWWKDLYFGIILTLELALGSATNLFYGLRHWNITEVCNNFLSDQTTQWLHFPRCPSDLYYCQQQGCFSFKFGISAGFTDSAIRLTT